MVKLIGLDSALFAFQQFHGVSLMKSIRQFISVVLSVALISMSFNSALAAMINNDQVITQVQQNHETAALLATINRADVKQQLLSLGVSTEDVESRIKLMTHEEVAQLNQQINELPAGGDVLGVLLIIFIVFVITDVIGATDIFPFIHPVN